MTDPREERFERQAHEWRDPLAVAAQWSDASQPEPELFAMNASGAFWEILARLRITLLIGREYEHLLLAVGIADDAPHITYFRMPHPSGLAFDSRRGILYVASTRNPNQIYEFEPVTGVSERIDDDAVEVAGHPIVPVRSRYLPGCSYIHDLAVIDGELHANSVGQNVILRLGGRTPAIAWWPTSLDRAGRPDMRRNYIQLNSIAAGNDIASSYFSASGEAPGTNYPGDLDYPVDGRGVVFAGNTREPMMRGLTRPHSARLHQGKVWVDNSGYGQLVSSDGAGGFDIVTNLPGWTRGLTFCDDVAFVGTSRVIPKFRQYAPGLDVDASLCAVHAVDASTGGVLGSLTFPTGNQLFAIEAVPDTWTLGFPFRVGERDRVAERRLFYAYTL